MPPAISVIICTHNPRAEILNRTLTALQAQTLPLEQWEFLLIDNASPQAINPSLVSWHPAGKVINERKLGLTQARLCAIEQAQGDLLVWCDDDNLLQPDYLEIAHQAFREHPNLGAAGGKSLPEYLEPPPDSFEPGLAPLGCRDLGDDVLFTQAEDQPTTYPPAAPIGAGMITRREAIQAWAQGLRNDPTRLALGRRGNALTSGEDNDINLTLLRNGWDLAYYPQLRLTHLIPPHRLTPHYQRRISKVSSRDFLTVLDLHGIRPWPAIPKKTVPLRKLKAALQFQPWKSTANSIRYAGICGRYEGQARLTPRPTPASPSSRD